MIIGDRIKVVRIDGYTYAVPLGTDIGKIDGKGKLVTTLYPHATIIAIDNRNKNAFHYNENYPIDHIVDIEQDFVVRISKKLLRSLMQGVVV